jgi:raffinose/stachyose/melibiose transport system permease protein
MQQGFASVTGTQAQTRQRLSRFLEQIAGPVFVLPALIFYVPFVVLPILATLYFVLFKWTGTGLHTMEYIGLQNFRELVGDRVFWLALRNNLVWGSIIVPIQIVLGLVLALIMVQRRRFLHSFQTLFMMPLTLSGIVLAVIFTLLFSPTYEVMNTVLRSVWLGSLANPWLGSATTSPIVIILVSLWGSFAFPMLVYVARIKGLSQELLDAARVDGANWFQQTWYITIPLLRPVTAVLIMLAVIEIFRMFGTVLTLTEGGPNHRTQVLALYAYINGFYYSRMGYGTTVSAVLLVICALITGLQMKWFGRE